MSNEEVLHRLVMLSSIRDLVITNYGETSKSSEFYDLIVFIEEVNKELFDMMEKSNG